MPRIVEVFDPVPWEEFAVRNIPRLVAHQTDHGFILRFGDVGWSICVSAVHEIDPNSGRLTSRNVGDLRLLPGDEESWSRQLRERAEGFVHEMHALHPFWKRASDGSGGVHLSLPYRTEAACNMTCTAWMPVAPNVELTCIRCIQVAACNTSRRAHPSFADVRLSDYELDQVRLQMSSAPAMARLRFRASFEAMRAKPLAASAG